MFNVFACLASRYCDYQIHHNNEFPMRFLLSSSSSDASDAPSSQTSTDPEQTASLISMPSLISVSCD